MARRLFRLVLGDRLPVTTGTVRVDGLSAPVAIHRDRWSVPHIRAESLADAFYGLGFCQGQDRAFQVETYKRVAAGTLSELVGAQGLPVDRLTRRLGLHRRAEAQLPDLRSDLRAQVEAFALGITDGATVGSTAAAHEFSLLRARPTPHTAVDVLATLKLQAFLLAGSWQDELARLRVLIADGEEALRELDPGTPEHLPATSPVGHAVGPTVDRLAADLLVLAEHVALGGASNNWAVAATRTAAGRPLVANDPHLPPTLPAPWYLAHLRTPTSEVAGAALAGTPGIAAGHNGHGAWGVTAGLTDDTDLFVERLDETSTRVLEGDEYVPLRRRREVIAVKGHDPIIEDVLETARGPILARPGADTREALSLSAVWLEGGPVEGFLDVASARTFDDLRDRFRHWPGMSLNVVWGDTSDTIGWQLVGELPVRRSGNGTVPMPGWLPETGWTDERVPFDAMPYTRDPALGFVATANNAPVRPASATAFLGTDFLDGYRAAAILDALSERDDWDVASTMALQVDTRSLPWLEVAHVFRGLAASSPDARRGLDLLNRWDGRVDADSPAAAVYELVMAGLARRVVRAKAPKAAEWLLGRSPLALLPHGLPGLRRTAHLVDLIRSRPDGWFAEGWDTVLVDTIGAAVGELRSTHGDDPASWAWGEVRPLTLRHAVSQGAKPLAAIFDRGPFPWPGDAHTIPQASPSPLDPTADPIAIASLRMVVDVGAWSASRWVLPGGQSGNPLSPHYDDQLDLWRAADGIPIAWTDDEVDAATVDTLTLTPR